MIVYLPLRAMSELGFAPLSLALHSLTIVVIGSVALGMMARTSLGRTGRPLTTSVLEVTCFLLLQGVAVARVGGA